MRAFTFVQNETGRGVVAFRGTDMGDDGSGVSGQADACANAYLRGQYPPECSRFPEETVDYLTRGLELVERAEAAYPGLDFLMTGHSLGAQLASLVGAIRGRPALTFSAPSVAPELRSRSAVDPASVGAWAEVSLYNEWDPLVALQRGNLVGAECVWMVEPAPNGCLTCYLGGRQVDMSRFDCQVCWDNAHGALSYLDLIDSRQRPACRTAGGIVVTQPIVVAPSQAPHAQ